MGFVVRTIHRPASWENLIELADYDVFREWSGFLAKKLRVRYDHYQSHPER
jgi:hypothetical protein